MSAPSAIEASQHPAQPLLFEEYFELGKEETASPFLKAKSRPWGAHLTLKASVIAAVLLLIAFLLSFSPQLIPLSHIALIGVYFLAGAPALIEALEDLATFEINIDILMTLAAFSSVLIGSGMEGGLLLVLFALSGAMEDYVTNRAKSNISSLHKLSPTKACVIQPDGVLLERSIREIAIGTHILVKSGQVVPLDGVVIAGASSVNLVHLTGENMPVPKKVGDEVAAGARNLEGALTLKVTRTSADSTVARIVQLVTHAQEERPILQRWFDRLSKTYALSIIGLSAAFALGLPLWTGIPYLGVEGSVYRALAFLIAASPCALVIALPIAYLSAIGVCARQGIMLKGGIILDALAKCKVLAFDKTGTLTTGDLQLVAIDSLAQTSAEARQHALAVAYTIEKNAVHPIAKALVSYGQAHRLPSVEIKNFQSIPGSGLSAVILTPQGEKKAFIGHPAYILSKVNKASEGSLQKHVEEAKAHGELVAVLLYGEELFLLRFRDTLRPQVKETIQELRNKQKMRLVMLTGDHEASAKAIAESLDIDEYHADLRPEDKLRFVSQLSAADGLAMIGDGVNDAPALARATVGICMGKIGSSTAIDAADIVLLQDNIERLGWLIGKAHQTQHIVKQNLTLATLAIVVASIPALAGFVPLWAAVLMHEGGTVLVGLNGLRLLRKEYE